MNQQDLLQIFYKQEQKIMILEEKLNFLQASKSDSSNEIHLKIGQRLGTEPSEFNNSRKSNKNNNNNNGVYIGSSQSNSSNNIGAGGGSTSSNSYSNRNQHQLINSKENNCLKQNNRDQYSDDEEDEDNSVINNESLNRMIDDDSVMINLNKETLISSDSIFSNESFISNESEFLPKIQYVSMLMDEDGSENNLSLEANALSLKYLNDGKLNKQTRQAAKYKQPSYSDIFKGVMTIYDDNKYSLSSKKYLEKHGLFNSNNKPTLSTPVSNRNDGEKVRPPLLDDHVENEKDSNDFLDLVSIKKLAKLM